MPPKGKKKLHGLCDSSQRGIQSFFGGPSSICASLPISPIKSCATATDISVETPPTELLPSSASTYQELDISTKRSSGFVKASQLSARISQAMETHTSLESTGSTVEGPRAADAADFDISIPTSERPGLPACGSLSSGTTARPADASTANENARRNRRRLLGPVSSSQTATGELFGTQTRGKQSIRLPVQVVGLQFREPAAKAASRDIMKRGEKGLLLEREPCNTYDPQAVRVLQQPTRQFLGYLPARIAAVLAPLMDAWPSVASISLKRDPSNVWREEDNSDTSSSSTLDAVLDVCPQGRSDEYPYSGFIQKLREMARKENKRRHKLASEAQARQERLQSKQRSLLFDFGGTSSGTRSGETASPTPSSSALTQSSPRGGLMLQGMPHEVLWQIFSSPGVSARELFGPVRVVSRSWKDAVNSMQSATSRRLVAMGSVGKAQRMAGSRSMSANVDRGHVSVHMTSTDEKRKVADAEGNEDESTQALIDLATPSNVSTTPKITGAEADGCVDAGHVCSHDAYPERRWWASVRRRLASGIGFMACDAAAVLRRLDWCAAMYAGDRDAKGAVGAPTLGLETGENSGSDSLMPPDETSNASPPEDDASVMFRHLAATRELCTRWELIGNEAGHSAAESRSGWEALALALVTAPSWARIILCTWAMRPLMGCVVTANERKKPGEETEQSPWCQGLPRGEIIELLCVILCALRSLESDEQASWAGAGLGSYRVKADLLYCIQALDKRDVRFMKPGEGDRKGTSGSMGGTSGLLSNLTSEQQRVVLTDVAAGGVLTVLAFAGTGKTTCLRAYAQARPHLKILYLTFNVSVREEAERTFPPHVDCKGVHQLAFRHVGRRFHESLTQDLRVLDVQSFLKSQREEKVTLAAASMVLATLNNFWASQKCRLTMDNVKVPLIHDDFLGDVVGEGAKQSLPPSQNKISSNVDKALILRWATMCWSHMQGKNSSSSRSETQGGNDGNEKRRPGLGMTHAGYLKLFQLSQPILGHTYDVIMLDEAQDSNPCIADIVLRETECARILVGDSHQAIYGFIGAEDHLRAVAGGKILRLTQVFRFQHPIAHMANTLVHTFKGETRPLIGCSRWESKVDNVGTAGLSVFEEDGFKVKRPFAFLARTLATLVQAAAMAHSIGDKVAYVGGIQGYDLDSLEDMCLLSLGRCEEVRHPLLKRLKTFNAFYKFVMETQDRQWGGKIRMLNRTSPEELIHQLSVLRRRVVNVRDADVILSTVHKAKGLEFDTVVLADDFMDLQVTPSLVRSACSEQILSTAEEEELNILYVAITRAKRLLVLNKALESFVRSTLTFDSISLLDIQGKQAPGEEPRPSVCFVCSRSATSEHEDGFSFFASGSLRAVCAACVQGRGKGMVGTKALEITTLCKDSTQSGELNHTSPRETVDQHEPSALFPYVEAVLVGHNRSGITKVVQ